ncbi:PREDICTED: high mobility group protein B1-like [Elephantulus edwardii]|uniref:high mobility group protein B1-like n=1 Tax=Elephantulus edwardii TaxID=28737 RepID=UPI0003F072D3|nr:PREDICTED: high mobility group protein B1-like [Elephantulus edwardii]
MGQVSSFIAVILGVSPYVLDTYTKQCCGQCEYRKWPQRELSCYEDEDSKQMGSQPSTDLPCVQFTCVLNPGTFVVPVNRQVTTGKGDPKQRRGKMSSYAFSVQTCREDHKKKHPGASLNFSEFSKTCSERWKTMSAKEKGKFEDMAKADKVHYERERKTYIPPKGETKKKCKDPNAPKRPPFAFFLFCYEYHPKIKGEDPGLSIGDVAKKLGEMWSNTAADDKQPYEKKAAKLKEKYEKDIAASRPDAAKKGVVKAEKSKKKKEEEDEEDKEDKEEEEDEDEEDDDDKDE